MVESGQCSSPRPFLNVLAWHTVADVSGFVYKSCGLHCLALAKNGSNLLIFLDLDVTFYMLKDEERWKPHKYANFKWITFASYTGWNFVTLWKAFAGKCF